MNGHKLSILIAKEAPIALILRRGTTEWYHLIKWNLKKDTLEHGAWFKGRIYEDYCDISNDGQYFLYKAFKGGLGQTKYKACYTGLSTVPWLKAHWILPIGTTYGGGGCFINDKTIAIYCPYIYEPAKGLMPHPDHQDTRGFKILHISHAKEKYPALMTEITNSNHHQDDNLIAQADWSKKLADNSIIWYKHYQLYRRYFSKAKKATLQGQDKLIADLTDLIPNPQPAPY